MNKVFETSHDLKSFLENGEFLYVIYCQYGCKIGYTKSPLERLEQIRLGLPSHKCIFIGLYIGERARYFENKLHEMFKKQRLSREWFYLTDEDNDLIENILSKNNFDCLIKQSIIWSNYLDPSIFIKGNVKIIETKKKDVAIKKKDINVPPYLSESILKPEVENLSNKNVKFMTATEISTHLKRKGFIYSREQIGMIMKSLDFKRGSKKIPGIGPRYGYFIIINDDY
jgi:hypothetical protein